MYLSIDEPVVVSLLVEEHDAAVGGSIEDTVLEIEDDASLVDDHVDEIELELAIEETCHSCSLHDSTRSYLAKFVGH